MTQINASRPVRWTRLVWGILGVPVAIISFAILVTLLFMPIGGGVEHVIFAYTDGRGSLGGARMMFIVYGIAQVLVLALLRRTRYPGPWYLRAIIVTAAAELGWLPILRTPEISRAFLQQGIWLALLFPVIAALASLIMTPGTRWLTRATWTTSPMLMLYRIAIVWAMKAACIGALLFAILFAVWDMIHSTGRSGGQMITQGILDMLFMTLMTSISAALVALPYSILLLAWLQVVRRYPAVDATPMRRFITTLVLALPLIAVVVCHFSILPGGSWDRTMALIVLPFATLICWGAVWIPRWRWSLN